MIYEPSETPTINFTTSRQFAKDYKRLERSGRYDLDKIEQILNHILDYLLNETTMDPHYRDHALIGEWKGCRECHLLNDLLLIYEIDVEQHSLAFIRLGTHAQLFE
ncbi:mRNA interferase toxin YafQ [Commensalibacter sp. Nvir]|uniref:type II toxin-antitoxin system YafQ family toxin n=1 Tax=Commensalibacter sp. Nvir TaxID=3069817 RepID=UPI002D5D4BD7|nr:mRNA interferase toxin YafQ [Commensalibacter sp. Nvir]